MKFYSRFAERAAYIAGGPYTFSVFIFLVIVWLALGPVMHFDTSWNFICNSSTTVLTCGLALLIQNTQNRDTRSVHIKLDELIRATGSARNTVIDIEGMTDEESNRILNELIKEAHGNVSHDIE